MPLRLKQILLLCLLTFPFLVYSQKAEKRGNTIEKRKKELKDKQEEREREDAAAYEELRQKHIGNQSKDVQKRMKSTQKKSSRTNRNKKEFFLKKKLRKGRKRKKR